MTPALKRYADLLARLIEWREQHPQGDATDEENGILDEIDDAWEQLGPGELDLAASLGEPAGLDELEG
jgi:hypothetical protein